MNPYFAEFAGTALLILMGSSINANVVLSGTKGHQSGWAIITLGWGIAVFVGVYASTALGGSGHLNPAVSVGLAVVGLMDAKLLAGYILAQMAGAMAGATLGWLAFKPHFDATHDPDAQLAVFSTSPAIRNFSSNLITEVIGTFVLVFGALTATAPETNLGALNALPVALLVMGIGMGLGGPTGYAINPARDLGPRIMHYILPISGKRDSDWQYSWIPVAGPLVGGVLAAIAYAACMG